MKKIKNIFMKLKDNIQFNQTIILSFLLIIGVEFYNLNISYLEISVTFITVILLDLFFIKNNTGKWSIPFSGINAGFGISFFLRSEDIILYFFAGLLAIVGKNIFKINGRHFFNPSNMGVFLVLILFPQYSWINTLQWGNYAGNISLQYFLGIILVFFLGFFISFRVKNKFNYNYILTIIFPFLIIHSILFFIIPFYENFSGYIEFFNISFLVFTFFMLTDPKTIPENEYSRFLYIISIVFSFYILQFFINESYAILGSLFINTLLLPVIWKLEIKYKKNKSIQFLYFYLILFTFELLYLMYLLNIYGQPDLLFDNVCGQLFCG